MWGIIVRIQELSSNIWLWLVMSFLPLLMAQSVRAQEQEQQNEPTVITTIKRLSEIEHPATNVSELFSQSSTPSSQVVQVTAVKANPTAKGVEVILQTTKGEQLQITNRSAGNSFIADIPNAQLRLPNGDGFTFRSEKPLAGVTEITVNNFDANTIGVTVIGEGSSPTVELFDSDEGLIFGLTTARGIWLMTLKYLATCVLMPAFFIGEIAGSLDSTSIIFLMLTTLMLARIEPLLPLVNRLQL